MYCSIKSDIKVNFIYKPQVKQQPQGCDQTEQQNVRLYPLYHSLGKKCTCNLSSRKPHIYTFFFLRHGGIYFWVLHVNKTINEIMTSTCYIIKLWLMWSTSNWLQHHKRVFKKHINDMLSWKILIIMDNVYKGFSFSVCFMIVTLILIMTFRQHTAGLHRRLRVKHDRDIQLSQTQTSAVSERANKTGQYLLWDEVKFIDRDPHWYSCRVNPLSPNSDQQQFSPNDIHTLSWDEVMRNY